jgi:hypothetical protein
MGEHGSTVVRIGRALQQEPDDLWPTAGPGRIGKNSVHVRPHHLVNLSIATALAGPRLTASPDLARSYSRLPVSDTNFAVAGPAADEIGRWKGIVGAPYPTEPRDGVVRDDPAFRVVPGNTLGEALAGLIDWLARPEGAALRATLKARGIKASGLCVTLYRARYIELTATIEIEGQSVYGSEEPFIKNPTGPVPEEHPGVAHHKTVLNFHLFDALADLWADTKARTGAK